MSSGDSGQLSSEGAKLPGSRKSSDTDSGLSPGSPGPGSGSQCSCSSHESASSPDIRRVMIPRSHYEQLVIITILNNFTS